MGRITSPVSELDSTVLAKKEEARCGDNLSIMSGALGICLQGAHPDLLEETTYDSNLAKKMHDVNVKTESYKIRSDFHPDQVHHIEKEMRFDFEKVLQIVDSETVLSMIKKRSTRFRVYEGVRIGEIQAATDGDLSCWAWMSGQRNTADWLTRGRAPEELNDESHWWRDPPILYRPIEEWGLKYNSKGKQPPPGEKKVHRSAAISVESPLFDYERFSDINKVIWTVARLLNIAHTKSFRGGMITSISAQQLQEAEKIIGKDV